MVSSAPRAGKYPATATLTEPLIAGNVSDSKRSRFTDEDSWSSTGDSSSARRTRNRPEDLFPRLSKVTGKDVASSVLAAGGLSAAAAASATAAVLGVLVLAAGGVSAADAPAVSYEQLSSRLGEGEGQPRLRARRPASALADPFVDDGSAERQRGPPPPEPSMSDFVLDCDSDRIVVGADEVPARIARSCALHSFGTFLDGGVELSCDASSLSGAVDCEVDPSFVRIDRDPFRVDVALTVLADGVLKEGAGEEGEMTATATYRGDARSSSIPLFVGDLPVRDGVLETSIHSVHVEGGGGGGGGSVDYFLLSGQSNMHGHTTSGLSIGSNETYWLRVKSIIDAAGEVGDSIATEAALETVIREEQADKDPNSPASVATVLANETMKLYEGGLLNDLDAALTFGSCSFVIPQDAGGVQDKSGGSKSTAWDSECGGTFGHEFTLARTLELEMGYNSSFETVKNSRDGTQIHLHWYPGYGLYWEQLRESISSKAGLGNWKGFVWHQGTQEAWTTEDTSLTYLGNLTGLVNAVRAEMYAASDPGTWQCKEEIPTVVVQIGHWPQNDRAQRVRDAQATFVAGDPRAALVRTDDLSRFYHFDAPSFLVGGNRIAHAYNAAMQGIVTCPVPIDAPIGPPVLSTRD